MEETEAKEFDASIGGTEHLPFSANSLRFASSRSVEIAAMTESILRPSKSKLIFQTLPVHMRRRVMSHNCKRLPRRLRRGHLEQLKKSGLPPKQKRPSRKYRRRPANLLEEYNRRQRQHIWLETHIWHAKRFHMTERWGHRLPYAPCDKAFRACYRGSSAHCLLQDISYYTPIQITGTVAQVKEVFAKITSCMCGLSIGAMAYINGTRQGTVHIYGVNTFPFGYVGKVEFIWVPSDSINKTLWLFVHPSQASIIQSVLTDASCLQDDNDYEVANKKRKVDSVTGGIEIKVMQRFNRFRLTGPNSHAILAESLKCISEDLIKNSKWTSLHKPKDLIEKNEYWESISTAKSPAQLPSHMVVGLVVIDPRLRRPRHRTKAKQNTDTEINTDTLLKIPPFLSNSPLWDMRIHESIKKELMTNGQFVKHLTKNNLVPGAVDEDDPALQCIPVVLVQRPGSQNSEFKKLGYGSGWDIIIPSGYALPFWLTFIMFGARSGGLRETESLAFEMGESHFPPDSNAGKENENRIESEMRDRYFKLPPSKRVNYNKIAINSPFRCPWNILLSDWSDDKTNEFFVLRNKTMLNEIQDCITQKKHIPNIENASMCLVPVYIKITAKGSLQRHALICLPEVSDLVNVKTLFEPHHEDPNEKTRKLKRKEHIKSLKKIKKKTYKLKKKLQQEKKPMYAKKLRKIHRQEPSDYVKTMRELWLSSQIETVRKVGAREVMGYVVQGAFSFTEARSCGVGYIAYNALKHLLDTGINQVLVRNPTSRKYRLANIVIIRNT
ncbi:hypothetical protein HF086_016972 [Spodoptera exigua]|uniref:Uncharacterized protein n=1 Tax=Spodoptera exigua TaxID=7107 RepID=A0A922M501_SPOEX|nr:hypothetical protein HF086_016972 [Spodoptera exigua]